MLRSAIILTLLVLFATPTMLVVPGCGGSDSSDKDGSKDSVTGTDVPITLPDSTVTFPDQTQPKDTVIAPKDTTFTFPDTTTVPKDTTVAKDVTFSFPDTTVVVPDTVTSDAKPGDTTTTGTCKEDDKGYTVDKVKSDAPELTLATDWAKDYNALGLCTAGENGTYFDWFKLKVEKKGSFVLSVVYEVTGACVDIDIYKDVPPSQSNYLIGNLDKTGTGTNAVEATLEPGVYFIRVSSWDGTIAGGCASAESGKATAPYAFSIKQASACTGNDACTSTETPYCVTSETPNKGLCVECTENTQCATKNAGASLLTKCGDGTAPGGGVEKENTCVCDGNDTVGVDDSEDPGIQTIALTGSTPVVFDNLVMCSDGDFDWFKLTVDVDSDVTITLNDGPTDADALKEFDIYFLEAVADGVVDYSYGSPDAAVNTLLVSLKAGTTYHIAINSYSGFGSYKLSLKKGGAAVCDPACENGGTCVEGTSGNVCQCPATHTGDHCQTLVVTGCDPACANGACYDDNGTKKCDCVGTSFKGADCGTPADCSTDGPGACGHGKCINKGNDKFVCECEDGFGGKLCDQDSPPPVWINELHYDNNLKWDFYEGVELAGPKGQDLSSWKLAFYGPGGVQYAAGSLVAGTAIPTTGTSVQNNHGTIWIPMPFPAIPGADWQTDGNSFLHNAGTPSDSPDKRGAGIALIDAAGKVVQFICYETVGSKGFTAVDGLAKGKRCEDIEVSENPGNSPFPFDHDEDENTPPVVKSLQLQGKGTNPWQFTWSADPLIFTPGLPNTNQTFE